MEVRRIKGDARMGELLRRALEGRRRPLEEDVSLRVRFARATLSAAAGQRPRRLHHRPARSLQGRVGWRCGPAWSARPGASSARRAAWAPTKPGSRASSRRPRSSSTLARHPVADRLPHRARPRPAVLSRSSWSATPRGLFSDDEWQLLLTEPGRHRLVDGVERRRPGPARRGRLPHRRPQPHLRAHRGATRPRISRRCSSA